MSFDLSAIPSWITQLIFLIIGSILGAFITYRFTLKAQLRNIKGQYIINNIERTYVPIVKEIQRIVDNYLDFFGQNFSSRHSTIATFNDAKKYLFSQIRNEGYFDIITSYNRKLSERIIHFYDDILPKLRETEEVNMEVEIAIENIWQAFIEKKYASERQGANLDYLGQQLMQKNKQILYNGQHHLWAIGSGLPLDEHIATESKKELIDLAKPHMQKLIEKYKQGLELLQKENVSQLIEDLRKTIGNPI